MTERPTPEALEAALAEWLREHCVDWKTSRPGGPRPRTIQDAKVVQAGLFDAGFVGVGWPTEHGGRDLTSEHDQAVARALSTYTLPTSLLDIGIGMCAPTIRAYGSPQQRTLYLHDLLRGERVWCQLFSEPGAGSDLAGLSTRAVADGAGWVVNGQKVWTSGAQHSDFGLLLARTDRHAPKHSGITAFIVPMDAPGVTVRPLRQITGEAAFNEVFLENVVLDDHRRLGPVGEGWRVATTTLSHERVAVAGGTRFRREPAGIAAARLLATLDLRHDPNHAERVGRLIAMDRAIDGLAASLEEAVVAGREPGPLGSIIKLAKVRLVDMLTAANLAIGGLETVAWHDGDALDGTWSAQILESPGFSIGGGTNDIQRNIVGERLLGLPRDVGLDRSTPFDRIPKSG